MSRLKSSLRPTLIASCKKTCTSNGRNIQRQLRIRMVEDVSSRQRTARLESLRVRIDGPVFSTPDISVNSFTTVTRIVPSATHGYYRAQGNGIPDSKVSHSPGSHTRSVPPGPLSGVTIRKTPQGTLSESSPTQYKSTLRTVCGHTLQRAKWALFLGHPSPRLLFSAHTAATRVP